MSIFSFKKNGKPHPIEVASDDKTSLGNILLGLSALTPDQLHHAVAQQIHNQEQFLGELLVEMKFITKEQLERAVLKQKLARGEKIDYAAEGNKLLSQFRATTTSLMRSSDEFQREASNAINRKLALKVK